MLRSEKLRLENTGQIVCIGSPGCVCKGFGAQVWDKKCTAATAVEWGWEAAQQASSCRFEGVHTPKSILDCSFLGSSGSFSQMNWA